MKPKVEYIFVYGTLMRGMANAHLLAPFAVETMAAEMAGRLYHLTDYPAVVLNPACRVKGEVVRGDDIDKALELLDDLEDYFGPGHPDNLYDRVLTEVTAADGRRIAAWVYVWARPEELPEIATNVAGGCWRKYYTPITKKDPKQ
jgi:gamma-glutamylcyclotransferase (GGCT)/AIG2-like uncharacterized protein YtfP